MAQPPAPDRSVLSSRSLANVLSRVLALLLAAAAPALLPAQGPRAENVAAPGAHVTSGPAASSVAAAVDSVLARPHLARAEWGVEVREAGTGRVLYSRGADRLLAPASGLKVVGAAAAAHHLHPEHRFRTTLYADGVIRDGVLEGDLVLYGRGDPTLSDRYFESRTAVFEALADSLAARGVRRIAGGIVADESWFDTAYVHGDWNPHDLIWWYAAPVGALGFNDNAIDLRVLPGPSAGAPARITPLVESAAYTLENSARTVARGRPATLGFERGSGPGRIRAVGDVPLGAGAVVRYVAVDRPAEWTAQVFRETLERRGIAVGRTAVRVVSEPARAPTGRALPLAEWRSPPLDSVLGPILMRSQNWFSELLVKTLGREVRGEGSWAAGLGVHADFLTGVVGVPASEFVLRDGSGLSSRNRITARAMVTLLEHVHREPGQRGVREALPVSGRSGSLERRLGDLPGRVAAKTGYISGVNSLSGYLLLDDGRELVFSILSSGASEPPARMRAGIDDVVRAVARSASR